MTYRTLARLGLLLPALPAVPAQELLFDLPYEGPVSGATDLDGDGRAEFLVGLRVFSGADASIVLDLTGVLVGPCDADEIGDVDGDGISDLAYVSTEDLGPMPCVYVGDDPVVLVSGADGSVITTMYPNLGVQDQVLVLAGAGDADGDGVREIAFGSEAWFSTCLDGAGGFAQFPALPNCSPSCSATSSIVFAVGALGDVNDDGLADAVWGVGPCGVDQIVVASNAGSQVQVIAQRGINGLAADAVASLGDFDGDGRGDVVAHDAENTDLYRVRVFSGADLGLLFEIPDAGERVAGPGDIDCNGVVDVLTSGPGHGTRLYSGSDGSILWSTVEEAGVDFLYDFSRLDGAGDVNGDGAPDWIVSFADHTQVWAGPGLPVATYCTAKTNSQGCVPFVQTAGVPSASAAQPFLATARQVLNQKSGLLFYGLNGRAAISWLGGTLCVQPGLKRTPIQSAGGNPPPDDCSGSYLFDLNAWIQGGGDPALVPGVTVNGQYWSRDPQQADGTGVGLTDAFEAPVCP